MPSDPLVVDRDAWGPRIQAEMVAQVYGTEAQTFKHAYGTASKPVVFKCADGKHWVVKAQFAKRGVASDCVLATIAAALGAPVPNVCRVKVSPELIAVESRLQNMVGNESMQAGVWHGSLWIDGIHDNNDKRANDVRPGTHNADRFGRLALFLSLCGLGDRQFVYEDDPPHLVHVVDMGHALPGADSWTASGLDAHVASASLPTDLWAASGYDKAQAEKVLGNIVDPACTIACAVGRPLDHWGGLTMDERTSLAHYLSRQFDALQKAVAAL